MNDTSSSAAFKKQEAAPVTAPPRLEYALEQRCDTYIVYRYGVNGNPLDGTLWIPMRPRRRFDEGPVNPATGDSPTRRGSAFTPYLLREWIRSAREHGGRFPERGELLVQGSAPRRRELIYPPAREARGWLLLLAASTLLAAGIADAVVSRATGGEPWAILLRLLLLAALWGFVIAGMNWARWATLVLLSAAVAAGGYFLFLFLRSGATNLAWMALLWMVAAAAAGVFLGVCDMVKQYCGVPRRRG